MNYVRIPQAAPAGGIPVTVSVNPTGNVKVSACNPSNYQASNCTGDTLGNSVVLNIPQGQNYAYFDIAGQATAFTDSRLNDPIGVFVSAGTGDVYVAEFNSYRIRKLSASGVLSTVAGNGVCCSIQNVPGPALSASFRPIGVVGDAAGNLYIATYSGEAILKVDTSGNITNVAGTPNQAGSANGVPGTGRLYTPYQVDVAPDGTLYIADFDNNKVRSVPATGPNAGSLVTIAGGSSGTTQALQATFGRISGVAVDPSNNDVYFSDYDNHKVYRMTQPAGTLEVVAGTGGTGFNGDQGDATLATIYYPVQLHIRGTSLYIADYSNQRVRRVTLGVNPRPIVTVAGTTTAGFSGEGDPAVVAQMNRPWSMWTDGSNNLVIADRFNQRVRQVSAADGKIRTIMGSGTAGYAGDGSSGRGVLVRAVATTSGVTYLAAEASMNVTQSSWQIFNYNTSQTTVSPFGYRVRETSPNGTQERMAADTTITEGTTGPFTVSATLLIPNNATFIDGTATPTGSSGSGVINIGANDTTFGATSTSVITVLPPAQPALTIDDSFGAIVTATGIRYPHYVRIPANAGPTGVAINITSSDGSRVALAPCNSTNYQSSSCTTGELPGAGITVNIPNGQNYAYFDLVGEINSFNDTRLNDPIGIWVSPSGDVYIAEFNNYRIRKLSASGVLSTVAGNGVCCSIQNVPGPALSASFRPIGVVGDAAGNLYIATYSGEAILKVDTSGNISTVAGTPNNAGTVDGIVNTGRLYTPYQVDVAPDGTLYIADFDNARVRRVPATGPNAGSLVTIAGGSSGTTQALQATFGRISGVAVDPSNNDVYFADQDNNKVYRMTQPAGALEVVAGTGATGFNGDQPDATQATLYTPAQLHIRGTSLYVADYNNQRIRRITLGTNPRPITTVAGSVNAGFSGDGDLAIVAQLNRPWGMWTDSSNNLYLGDRFNHRVREVTASDGKINTIIGNGNPGFDGDGLSGRGVTIHAEVGSGGPSYLPVDVGSRVNQSTWQITGVSSTQSGPTFNATVSQSSSEISQGRMNQSTTFSLLSTATSVFTLPPDATIANNAATAVITATTIGAGPAQIVAQSSATGIAQGATGNITVLPVITTVTDSQGGPAAGNAGTTTAITINGRNLITASSITAPSGVTATITGGSSTALTANVQVASGTASGAKTLTLVTPGGNVTFTFTVN